MVLGDMAKPPPIGAADDGVQTIDAPGQELVSCLG